MLQKSNATKVKRLQKSKCYKNQYATKIKILQTYSKKQNAPKIKILHQSICSKNKLSNLTIKKKLSSFFCSFSSSITIFYPTFWPPKMPQIKKCQKTDPPKYSHWFQNNFWNFQNSKIKLKNDPLKSKNLK